MNTMTFSLDPVPPFRLGLSVDLAAFYRFAEADARLGHLVQRFRGVKPPRFPTLFEALVNGIACQQITLTQGIHLLNRLTQTYGLVSTGGDPPRTPSLVRTISPG